MTEIENKVKKMERESVKLQREYDRLHVDYEFLLNKRTRVRSRGTMSLKQLELICADVLHLAANRLETTTTDDHVVLSMTKSNFEAYVKEVLEVAFPPLVQEQFDIREQLIPGDIRKIKAMLQTRRDERNPSSIKVTKSDILCLLDGKCLGLFIDVEGALEPMSQDL